MSNGIKHSPECKCAICLSEKGFPKEEIEHTCVNCEHKDISGGDFPCCDCSSRIGLHDFFKPK